MRTTARISVGFAVLAAVFWAGSAVVNLPRLQATYEGIDPIEEFGAALRKVSRLNVFAAACACLSVRSQAVSIYLTP